MANTTLSWEMRHVLKELRPEGRLAVYVCYLLHGNERNRAWPSVETIVKETGWESASVVAAKKWLVEHGALDKVAYRKRAGREESLHPRSDVMQITGVISIDGREHNLLHFNISLGEILPGEISLGESEVINNTTEDIDKQIEIVGAVAPKPSKEELDRVFDLICAVCGLKKELAPGASVAKIRKQIMAAGIDSTLLEKYRAWRVANKLDPVGSIWWLQNEMAKDNGWRDGKSVQPVGQDKRAADRNPELSPEQYAAGQWMRDDERRRQERLRAIREGRAG